MTTYRFLNPMGDVVAEAEFADHPAALAWAHGDAATDESAEPLPDEEIHRVEFLGPGGDWRWAGAMHG